MRPLMVSPGYCEGFVLCASRLYQSGYSAPKLLSNSLLPPLYADIVTK